MTLPSWQNTARHVVSFEEEAQHEPSGFVVRSWMEATQRGFTNCAASVFILNVL